VGEIRAERGWTQEEFAARLRVSARYVQSVEAGRQNLTLSSLARLTQELGAPVRALFDAPTTRAGRGRPSASR
jgi:transcriptional regulator with XRE-family HTH domain